MIEQNNTKSENEQRDLMGKLREIITNTFRLTRNYYNFIGSVFVMFMCSNFSKKKRLYQNKFECFFYSSLMWS